MAPDLARLFELQIDFATLMVATGSFISAAMLVSGLLQIQIFMQQPKQVEAVIVKNKVVPFVR